jgi:hypothetical protein
VRSYRIPLGGLPPERAGADFSFPVVIAISHTGIRRVGFWFSVRRLVHGRALWRLTIRSSGPLRRSAVLSCGTRQRPLNSSVRLSCSFLLACNSRLDVVTLARFGRAALPPARQQLHAFGLGPFGLRGRWSHAGRAVVPSGFRRRAVLARQPQRQAAPAARAQSGFRCRWRASRRRPLPVRSSQHLRACVAHCMPPQALYTRPSLALRPNYSFKRTAATGGGTTWPRSAAAA